MRLAPALLVGLIGALWGAAFAAGHATAATRPSGKARVAASFGNTTTPIKHVIVIIGENHTFDNVFATYQPPKGQSVRNLLSEGIVNTNGDAGPNYSKALQQTASDTSAQGYQVAPAKTGPYSTLPQPNTTYVPSSCDGQTENSNDTRFPANLPNGPYPITRYVPYTDDHGEYGDSCPFNGAWTGDPIHRFYQMYQQIDGGANDLFTWVHQTANDANGVPGQPPDQGALEMGFYNVARGDAPTLNYLAHNYAMSDNYHQSVMGGTGANHIMLGTGDAAYYQDANGNPTPPPSGEIENPNAMPGTNNYYSQDGYGAKGTTNGGSYSNCSDHSQPGVSGVFAYLATLSYKTFSPSGQEGDCAPGHYYLLNNYNPGYNVDGSPNTSTFTVPPQQNMPTIGGELSGHGLSWGYYGEGYDNGKPGPNYCGICDPMQYSSQVMTNPSLRANIQHGLGDFDSAVNGGSLPAVSFVKPGDDDGHPAYSTLYYDEAFVRHILDEVESNSSLWKSTAIFFTEDEGGGYYDSGYVQPVSFFGDGTRVPMIAVSPYAKPGYISHNYTDHVSLLKFIEANWRLPVLSSRSLDNLPNPIMSKSDPYVPTNRPSVGNLMDMFNFAPLGAGLLQLNSKKLTVRGSRVYVPFTCYSHQDCNGNFSIVTHTKSAKTHVRTTVVCTKSSTTFFRIPAGTQKLVSAGISKGCKAELKTAGHHRLSGKLSSAPRTGQRGLIKLVTVIRK